MRKLGLFFLAVALYAQDGRNPHTTPADIAAGAKTFSSHCAPCHGYKAEGGRGPNLAAGHFYHGSTDAELFENITNGIPGTEMPGIFFSPDRVWQIVAFIRSLSGTAAKPSGDVAAGRTLFQSKGCAQCHRIGGGGGALGPDLSEVGVSRSIENLRQSIVDPDAQVPPRYWTVSFNDPSGRRVKGFLLNDDTYTVQLLDMNEHLHSYDKAALRNYIIDKHSAMPSYRDSLTAEELNNLVAYLWSQRPQVNNQ
jgi:cytochrome c oxidase cbb3-type subunit III